MASQLRALVVLPVGPSLIPSTHIAAKNCLTPGLEAHDPLLDFMGTHGIQTRTTTSIHKEIDIFKMYVTNISYSHLKKIKAFINMYKYHSKTLLSIFI